MVQSTLPTNCAQSANLNQYTHDDNIITQTTQNEKRVEVHPSARSMVSFKDIARKAHTENNTQARHLNIHHDDITQLLGMNKPKFKARF